MINSMNKPYIISALSTKGGVGKTTNTANIGGFLADQGYKVLLIDADVQPALSNYYSVEDVAPNGLQFLMTQPEVTPADVVSIIEPNLHIIISDDPESELQQWVKDTPDGRFRLRSILKQRFTEYDFILIDTQGAVGALQEATAIAADLLISPVLPEKLSASEFSNATIRMLSKLHESSRFIGFNVAPMYAFLNQTNETTICSDYSEQLKETNYPELTSIPISFLKHDIPFSVVYKEAASLKVPAHRHERKSRRKSGSAYDSIKNLCSEMLNINFEEANHG